MSKTMSLRLTERQLAAVEIWGRRYNQRSISASLQLLLEEKLREEEYAYISFRDSGAGRQPYVTGTGLAVWEVMMIARGYGDDVARTAHHLDIPEKLVRAAVTYATNFREEIDAALAENDAIDFAALQRMLPNIERLTVPLDPDERAPNAPAM